MNKVNRKKISSFSAFSVNKKLSIHNKLLFNAFRSSFNTV